MRAEDQLAHHGEVTDEELDRILAAHQIWLDSDGGASRPGWFDLTWAISRQPAWAARWKVFFDSAWHRR